MSPETLRAAVAVPPLTGAGLRDARQALGLTQSELAAVLDLKGEGARRTIRRWEKDEWPVPWTVAVTIAALRQVAG